MNALRLAAFLTQKRRTLISLCLVSLLGLAAKFYSGPAARWANNSLSGVFYEIFWCLVLALLFRRLPAATIAGTVFAITCLLECLQLWHPPFLQFLRSNFWGRALLGDTFAWSDFAYYLGGSAVGWIWVKWLRADASPSQGCPPGE